MRAINKFARMAINQFARMAINQFARMAGSNSELQQEHD